MAVTGTITITTLMFFYIVRHQWRTPLWVVLIGGGALLTVDLLFVAANLTKFVHGAWLPLLIGVTAFTIMTTWQRGRADRHRPPQARRGLAARLPRRPPQPSLSGRGASRAPRSSSTATSMTAPAGHARQRRARTRPHEHVLIVAVNTLTVPRVPPSERIIVDDLGYADDGITHVEARFGYMETPDVPSALALVDPAQCEFPLHLDSASYFVSTIELRSGTGTELPSGRSASSSRRRTSPPTPPTTSGCHATGP